MTLLPRSVSDTETLLSKVKSPHVMILLLMCEYLLLLFVLLVEVTFQFRTFEDNNLGFGKKLFYLFSDVLYPKI